MMPNTSVNPAASRKRSRPNCKPLRHCSINSVIRAQTENYGMADTQTAAALRPPPSCIRAGSLHVTLVNETILVVFHNGCDGLENKITVLIFHSLLQIEVLDRDVIGVKSELSPHRFEIGLFQRLLHSRLVCQITLGRSDGGGNQVRSVIGLRPVERWPQPRIFLDVVGNELLVRLVWQIVHPLLHARNAKREIFLQRQREFVDSECSVERNLTLETGLRVLTQELHPRLAGIKNKDRVGFFSFRFGELGGKVEMIWQIGQFMSNDRAF